MSAEGIEARFRLERTGFTLDVDLTLPGRGVTALFGPSGSGKTTLLRLIAGLERAHAGRLVMKGEVWQDGRVCLPVHKRPVGYVFQEASLFPHLTARANLAYGMRRAADPLDAAALAHLIALLGIDHLLDRYPHALSGGERQRVAIARALALKPRLLLMDEPLSALDLARKREILPYLERLHDTLDIPVLYVSHAADEVARLADHLVLLQAGRVLAQGPLAETLARLDLPVRLGEEAGVVLDARVSERDENWHLVRVTFPGGQFWARDSGHPVGAQVRVRVLARDVSIALERSFNTSILNALPATVEAIAEDEHPALALLRLRLGPSPLLARLTRRSIQGLGLEPGRVVIAQVKAVALLG
ncbi:MAG: molybdenum ABC transporter ATP-binding protein [Burkholderiales bacterium]|nr:molybdenum ABC transporter ATP-binding protein [Burkholderiales bacterium]